MSEKVALLHVLGTVGNLRLCDYALNLWIDKKVKKKYWLAQSLSYVTHPLDLVVQAIAFFILEPVNPVFTVYANLRNKDYPKALVNTVVIPLKFGASLPKIANYEFIKIAQLALSILGINTAWNMIRGRKQTDIFFKNRLQIEVYLRDEINPNRRDAGLTKKKIRYLVHPHVHSSFKEEYAKKYPEEATQNLTNKEWIKNCKMEGFFPSEYIMDQLDVPVFELAKKIVGKVATSCFGSCLTSCLYPYIVADS